MSDEARRRSVARAAMDLRRALRRLTKPAGDFDASRYFRGTGDLGFYNVRTADVRRLARDLATAHADDWSVDDAIALADTLIKDRVLEVKNVGIEVVSRFRRRFTRAHLPTWKRWLAANHSDNWATTDTLCGALIGPLLLGEPHLVREIRGWARHPNLWVRRASAVSLVPLVRRGLALDDGYRVARVLARDREDLIHKATGWLLREAGKTDRARLERFLRTEGRTLSRTAVRYAIERFPERKRRSLLAATRAGE